MFPKVAKRWRISRGGGVRSGEEADGLDDFKELLAGRLFATDRFPSERHNLKSGNLGNVGEDEMGGERKKEVQYIQVAYGFDPNQTYILCFVYVHFFVYTNTLGEHDDVYTTVSVRMYMLKRYESHIVLPFENQLH